MQLGVRLHDDHLGIVWTNAGSTELRLWDLENSWGWFATSFQIRGVDQPDEYLIERADRDWTKNAPTYFSLAPGQEREITLDLNDGWWNKDERVSSLKDLALSIRATYRVEATPEASRSQVYVGTLVSDWVMSAPPHRWLFAGA